MIKESIKALISVSKHQNIIDDYARTKYNEKFKVDYKSGVYSDGSWHKYDGFNIISENEIRVDYNYGYGDMEYSDSFKVNITEDNRDSTINEILK